VKLVGAAATFSGAKKVPSHRRIITPSSDVETSVGLQVRLTASATDSFSFLLIFAVNFIS
jgi:hypothetical protein